MPHRSPFILGTATLLVACTPALASEVASPASGALICGERHLLAQVLDGREQRRQRAIGVTARGELLELYMAVDGSWAILSTTSDGGACIIEDGKAEDTIPSQPNA